MRSLAAGLVSALLCSFLALGAGCTMMDTHEKVAGWPQMRIVRHDVPDREMFARCSKYTSWGFLPEACSEFYFDTGECHMWFSRDYPPQPWVVKHEVEHCEGYEHAGDTSLRDILARYNAQKRVSGSASPPPG